MNDARRGPGRRRLVAALSLLPALPARPAAGAERRRLGVLLFDTAQAWDFLRRDLPPALARQGWQEGRNLEILWRFADGDGGRLDALAQALLREGVDALLTRGTPATRALQRATTTVPIVTGVGNPVGAGFAASLAAPGGNITGLSYAQVEQSQKQVELLRALVPSARHLLILQHVSHAATAVETGAVVQTVARQQGLQSEPVLAARAEDLRRAAAAARQQRPKGTVVAFAFDFGPDIELALSAQQERVPTVFGQRAYVDAGGLLSYQLLWDDQTQRTADQLAKVLRGMPAAAVPFEQPLRSEFVLNARSAMALGLTVPADLLARADEVIR